MPNLTDVYEMLQRADEPMIKQAEELQKIAEEEDAAGRLMARGFVDELNKLAGAGPGIMGGVPQMNINPAAMVQKARQSAAQGNPVTPKAPAQAPQMAQAQPK